mmetsp:Transcript_26702/g.72153  ORF Transcript_26702/g.72153 Transcript_26702/m.72153 type:complete len:224 (+) Transcript_26702:537-1208(+)
MVLLTGPVGVVQPTLLLLVEVQVMPPQVRQGMAAGRQARGAVEVVVEAWVLQLMVQRQMAAVVVMVALVLVLLLLLLLLRWLRGVAGSSSICCCAWGPRLCHCSIRGGSRSSHIRGACCFLCLLLSVQQVLELTPLLRHCRGFACDLFLHGLPRVLPLGSCLQRAHSRLRPQVHLQCRLILCRRALGLFCAWASAAAAPRAPFTTPPASSTLTLAAWALLLIT